MRTFLLYLSLLFMITGCSTQSYRPMDTVAKVDLKRYTGRWYEIARYEHSFEKGCQDVTATYSIDEAGDIRVINRCRLEDGSINIAKGIAYSTDQSNSKLKVSFFRPFYGDYWILLLDEDYEYALVGEPTREYLWILSRTPKMDPKTMQQILNELDSLGYSKDELIWTPQGESNAT